MATPGRVHCGAAATAIPLSLPLSLLQQRKGPGAEKAGRASRSSSLCLWLSTILTRSPSLTAIPSPTMIILVDLRGKQRSGVVLCRARRDLTPRENQETAYLSPRATMYNVSLRTSIRPLPDSEKKGVQPPANFEILRYLLKARASEFVIWPKFVPK